MRLVVGSLFLVGVLFGIAGTASADRKVDWSQYLEAPGERTPKKATPAVAKEAKKAKAPRAAAAAKQRPAKAVAKRKTGRRR